MKFLKGLFTFILVLIIIGGLGYLGYMFLMPGMNHFGMNMTPNTNTQNQVPNTSNQTPDNQQTPQQNNNTQSIIPLNTIAVQNRDKLSQALATINSAIELITIDPYGNAAMPYPNLSMEKQQDKKDTGTINIYPSGNSSVNLTPTTIQPTQQAQTRNDINQEQDRMLRQNVNVVYDQVKLQQLHSGIFTLAQGMATINMLNDDLMYQTTSAEANPPTYQTYAVRYNTALQNKANLNKAINLLTEASSLVNINPYASADGYQFNKQAMQQLNQGIYKLSQGMVMLNRLNEDFTNQMAQAAYMAQGFITTDGTNTTVSHSATGHNILGNLNFSTIFNLILILLVVGLIVGVLGGILNMLKSVFGGRPNNDQV